MLTDLAEIRRLTAANQAENLAFQRHLAAHHYPAEPFRIPSRTVEKQIDCMACANCCRQTQVGLSSPDIGAIARYLAIEPQEVIRRYTTPDPDDSRAKVLRHTKDGFVFLDTNLCMAYETRRRYTGAQDDTMSIPPT